MDNTYKLIIIVLTFFLALTLVDKTYALAEPIQVQFNGSSPTSISFTITNPLTQSALPSIQFVGPFSAKITDPVSSVSKNKSLILHATLTPSAEINARDTYTGIIRVRWNDQVQDIPLRISTQTSFWGNNTSDSTSNGATGLIVLPALSNLNLVDVLLIILIIILAIALLARIKHRLEGK